MARPRFELGSTNNFSAFLEEERKSNKKHELRKAIIDDAERKLQLDGKITFKDECRLVGCITPTNGTGKMEFIPGCPDTNCLGCGMCHLRVRNCKRLPDADPSDPFDGVPVCTLCYSADNENNYDALAHSTEDNGRIMRTFDISEDAWATLPIAAPLQIVRGEMHGDSSNTIQTDNNIKIVRSHEFYDFTFWGKNLGHWNSSFSRLGKPTNMMFVASSTYINRIRQIPASMVWFVDQVFTVISKQYALTHDVVINCGKYEGIKRIDHKCRTCMRCYTEHHEGEDVGYIFELLK